MAQSQYLYQVAVDTGSAQRAAANVKKVFQEQMAQISTAAGGAASR